MGRKKAVLIGCNYPGTDEELKGCVNDVWRMYNCLVQRYGFYDDDIQVLIDTDYDFEQPTGRNIRRAIANLVRSAEFGDVLFVHFSGHGFRLPSESEDDNTGFDECIVPTDINLITDDDLRQFVNQVPSRCLVTIVADSCHSGGLIANAKEQIGESTKKQSGQTEYSRQGASGSGHHRHQYSDQGTSGSKHHVSQFSRQGTSSSGHHHHQHSDQGTSNSIHHSPRLSHQGRSSGHHHHQHSDQGTSSSIHHSSRLFHQGTSSSGRHHHQHSDQGTSSSIHHSPRLSHQGTSRPGQHSYQRTSTSIHHSPRLSHRGTTSSGHRHHQYSDQGTSSSKHHISQFSSRGTSSSGRHHRQHSSLGRHHGQHSHQGTSNLTHHHSQHSHQGTSNLTHHHRQHLANRESQGGYRSRQGTLKNKYLPLSNLIEILKRKTGKDDICVGKLRLTLFDIFGEDVSPKIMLVVDAVNAAGNLAQGLGYNQVGEVLNGIGNLAQDFLNLNLEDSSDQVAYAAGTTNPTRPRRGILISACQSDESAFDCCPPGEPSHKAFGALSNVIQTIIDETNAKVTNRALVLKAREMLKKQGFNQRPGLYCSDHDADARFLS